MRSEGSTLRERRSLSKRHGRTPSLDGSTRHVDTVVLYQPKRELSYHLRGSSPIPALSVAHVGSRIKRCLRIKPASYVQVFEFVVPHDDRAYGDASHVVPHFT